MLYQLISFSYILDKQPAKRKLQIKSRLFSKYLRVKYPMVEEKQTGLKTSMKYKPL
jgi:hypothetical protein